MDQHNNSLAPNHQMLLGKAARPKPEQKVECPRCKSGNTKFCYYNNYSMSQPRYFCKACRRYWTHGGSLRNVPIGGGCRKNRRSDAKTPPAAAVTTCFPNVLPTFASKGHLSLAFLSSSSALPRGGGDGGYTGMQLHMPTTYGMQLQAGTQDQQGGGMMLATNFGSAAGGGGAQLQHANNVTNNIIDNGCYNWSNGGWQGLINNSQQL